MARKVELAPYDPDWAEEYHNEAQRITPVFGSNLIAIHHIGSTSISDIPLAKPIIDMLVEVKCIEEVEHVVEEMTKLGYIYKGENGIQGRRYFRKGSDSHHTHHIHIFQSDHPEIARHLGFRDYMIAHPQSSQAYSKLKAELARQFMFEPAKYTSGKENFISDILRKVTEWKESLGSEN
jgi:GrpB-like predicted nucleotidyltransferase (UPF0157 family)